jgi:2-polyprenyl-3-methyl-5-hydroxy-6-metoxy-1,4-benzoquinol methylase
MDDSERTLRRHAYENPRLPVQALVPRGARRILDLGCASGALGAALKARQGAEVVGVEIEPAYATDAQGRLDRVVVADIEALAARDDLESELGRFDCLIAADVLEHLVDPWAALRAYTGLLEPGGHAVISLPNVRYWETFWQLGCRGTWPRRVEGIFDRSHLRWFTLADAQALCVQAGLQTQRVEPLPRLRPHRGRGDGIARYLRPVPLIGPLFVFQYVLAATKP